MVNNVKISAYQFVLLVCLFAIGTTILNTPSPLAAIAKQDAWIVAIMGVGLSFFLVLVYNTLASRYTHLTLIQINEIIFGKWVGKLISLLFVFFALITSSELVYLVGNFITTVFMVETPMVAVNALFVGIIVMGVRLGLETLARTGEILFPLFVLLFIILAVFVAPQSKVENLQPIMETDIQSMISGLINFIGIFSLSSVVLLMIFPASVNQLPKGKKGFYFGLGIGGGFLIITVLLTILVLGPDITAKQLYPSYELAKKINVGEIVQRIEALMAGMWFITIFFRATLYFYAVILGLAQTLNVKDYRSFTWPLGLIMVTLSLFIHPNIIYSNTYDREIWFLYASTYGLLLPLILLVGDSIRKRLRKSS